MKQLRARGFTLIELMIVVAVIAILAAVAVPAYTDYLRKGQIPEAFTFLSDYRVKMEQYFQDNRNYGTAACADTATWNFAPTGANYFKFTCANDGTAAAPHYTLTATGNGKQAVGHEYTIDSDGKKTTTMFKGSSTSKACWLISGNEC